MRHTEFWARMRHHLGAEYAESWAKDQHLSELEGMTVLQALDDGVAPRAVWHAVCAVLGLPARER